MAEILEQLHTDHRNYSRLLNLLQAEVDRIADGDDPDFLLMRDIMKYMVNYPDILHHPAEELLFEELGEVSGEEAETIERLSREHSLLAELAQELQELLENAISGHIVSKDRIRKLAGDYLEVMKDHMMREERSVFPLFESRLRQENLERAREKLRQSRDPVFSKPESDEYRNLYKSIVEGSGE